MTVSFTPLADREEKGYGCLGAYSFFEKRKSTHKCVQRLPPMNEWRENIAKENDGTNPAEPGQRCSQIILEAWLKKNCLAYHSIKSRFGWKYLSHTETVSGVESKFIDFHNQQHVVRRQFLVGADGGSSRVRKKSSINMLGGPLPTCCIISSRLPLPIIGSKPPLWQILAHVPSIRWIYH